jgi:hypothetical protein
MRCLDASASQTRGESAQLSLALNPFVELSVSGTVGHAYQIQYADDVGTQGRWEPLKAVTFWTPRFTLVDTRMTHITRRFYRAVLLP